MLVDESRDSVVAAPPRVRFRGSRSGADEENDADETQPEPTDTP